MNNNELCSDWLFHSATHQQEGTQGEKYIFLAVISSGNYTVLIREALKLLLNDQSIAL